MKSDSYHHLNLYLENFFPVRDIIKENHVLHAGFWRLSHSNFLKLSLDVISLDALVGIKGAIMKYMEHLIENNLPHFKFSVDIILAFLRVLENDLNKRGVETT